MFGLALALSLAVWAALHAAALRVLRFALDQAGTPGLADAVLRRVKHLSASRATQLRQLVRCQLYYAVVAPLGVRLLVECASLDDLLRRFTPLHAAAFALAVGHWLVAFVEQASQAADPRVRESFVAFAHVEPRADGSRGGIDLFGLYLCHHALAVAAFGWCLATRELGGMAACGLLFELPVFFVNLRDLMRIFEPELRWGDALGGAPALRNLWSAAGATIVPGRLVPICLFGWSLTRWAGNIDALPYATRVALLCFGCGFSALSLSWALFLIEYEHPNSTQPPTRT